MLKRFFQLLFIATTALLITSTAYSDGFELTQTKTGYELIPRAPGIALPGTNMRAGNFQYDYDDPLMGAGSKAGILVDNKTLYYVESDGKNKGVFDITEECTFGIYHPYLVMDGACCATTSGNNDVMFLFRYDKGTVTLLDVLKVSYKYGFDFMSVTTGERKINGDSKPLWTKTKDLDNDGRPEIKIRVLELGYFFLYLEIRDEQLKVDFNPALYLPLFEREAKIMGKKGRTRAYYIYGFLAKKFSIEDLMNMFKNKDKKRYGPVVDELKNVDRWDAAFHEYRNDKPVLKKYEIKRR
ncbi:MAG: hypothetical protein HZB82_05430 [Deltaproteobacteria bacterium]|nr:hypothetical protein [Deltaproteobacteria bacterium]